MQLWCLFVCLFVVVTDGTLALLFVSRIHSAQHGYCSPITANKQTKGETWLVGWLAVQLFGRLAV
jgi:hypothetical protein